jgi:hypothetical protein
MTPDAFSLSARADASEKNPKMETELEKSLRAEIEILKIRIRGAEKENQDLRTLIESRRRRSFTEPDTESYDARLDVQGSEQIEVVVRPVDF